MPPLVSDSQKIAALEGIHAEVALVQEPAPRHHPPVAQSGVGVNEPASDRAVPVGADDQVEVHCAARAKMQRRYPKLSDPPMPDAYDPAALVRHAAQAGDWRVDHLIARTSGRPAGPRHLPPPVARTAPSR